MVRVWDIFVRISHWTVALGFFVAYLTEDELLALHVWAGYLVGILVVARLVWGFVGPKHARFSDFVAGPTAVLGYLQAMIAFRAPRYLGHSPAGGAMAIALWLGLLAAVWSGMEFYAAAEGRGPLAAVTASPALSVAKVDLIAPARASEDENADEKEQVEMPDGEGESAWKEIHEVLANLVMILVILHVAGVVLAILVHRENLVRAMIDGRKRAE